jgi:hypothetical protein
MTTALQEQMIALRRFRYHLAAAQIQGCRVQMAELRLDQPDADLPALSTVETALAFAAKRLVQATDELPPERRPKGWGDER